MSTGEISLGILLISIVIAVVVLVDYQDGKAQECRLAGGDYIQFHGNGRRFCIKNYEFVEKE